MIACFLLNQLIGPPAMHAARTNFHVRVLWSVNHLGHQPSLQLNIQSTFHHLFSGSISMLGLQFLSDILGSVLWLSHFPTSQNFYEGDVCTSSV